MGGLRNPPGGRPPGKSNKGNNWKVTASVNNDVIVALKDICKSSGKTKSELVRELIIEGLAIKYDIKL